MWRERERERERERNVHVPPYMHAFCWHMYNIHIHMQLFCHPKYSILYGALMIFVVGSGQE